METNKAHSLASVGIVVVAIETELQWNNVKWLGNCRVTEIGLLASGTRNRPAYFSFGNTTDPSGFTAHSSYASPHFAPRTCTTDAFCSRHDILWELVNRYPPRTNVLVTCRSTRAAGMKKIIAKIYCRVHITRVVLLAAWNASRTKWNISWKSQMHLAALLYVENGRICAWLANYYMAPRRRCTLRYVVVE